MIAIPSAFVGAMENWGLLTYGYFLFFFIMAVFGYVFI